MSYQDLQDGTLRLVDNFKIIIDFLIFHLHNINICENVCYIILNMHNNLYQLQGLIKMPIMRSPSMILASFLFQADLLCLLVTLSCTQSRHNSRFIRQLNKQEQLVITTYMCSNITIKIARYCFTKHEKNEKQVNFFHVYICLGFTYHSLVKTPIYDFNI